MPLTSELKNSDSPIHQFFDLSFPRLDEVVKTLNQQIINKPTILPSNQANYPWAEVGHMVEYLLDLHIGLHYEDLYPMQILKKVNLQTHEILITRYPTLSLDSRQGFEQACFVLFKLAILEGWARRGSIGNWNIFLNAYVSKTVIEDLWNIYNQSIRTNSLINQSEGMCYYNPNFTLSGLVGGADADLIISDDGGGFLIDLKTTKNPKITKEMIHQLLGYTFLDEEDEFNIKTVGIYLTRQNFILEVSVDYLISEATNFRTPTFAKDLFCALVHQHYH